MNIFKRASALNMLLILALQLMAQGPNDSGTYYQSADGKKGSALKTAMSRIIVDHKELSYNALWDAFKSTDKRPDGKYGTCILLLISYLEQTKTEGQAQKKANITTVNTQCQKAGLTMKHQCTQTLCTLSQLINT